MTRKQFMPGVQFTIGKSKTIYKYEQLDVDDRPLNRLVIVSGCPFGYDGRTKNVVVISTGITVFTFFGDLELNSKTLKYEQLSIVEAPILTPTI